MSREGAYRLRRRPDAALFRAAWDRAMAGRPVTFKRSEVDESHRRLPQVVGPSEKSLRTINLVTFERIRGQMLLWSAGTPSGIVAAPSPTVHCECAPTP